MTTPTRLALLEAVAEAASAQGGAAPLMHALAALRAHDAAQPAAGVVEKCVEVRAVVFANNDGAWTVYGNHCDEDEQIRDECKRLAWDDETPIATITARVPLPSIPVIAADVEVK